MTKTIEDIIAGIPLTVPKKQHRSLLPKVPTHGRWWEHGGGYSKMIEKL